MVNLKKCKQLGMICAAASIATAAHAQGFGGFGDFGGFGGDQTQTVSTPAWQQFKLNPKTRVTLDFRNANPDAVLHYLSRVSGIAIIKDPTFKTPITVQSPHAQSLDDAFAMLNAVLDLNNFQLEKQGDFLVIKAKPQQFGRGAGFGNFGNFGTGSRGSRQSLQLKVYHLQYASASSVAKVINDVFAPTTTQNQANGFGGAFGGFPGAPGAGAAPTGGGGFGGRGRRGGGGGGGNNAGNDNSIPLVKASSDDYSNSLIVNAANRQQDEIADIIAQIDKPTDQPDHARVFKLKYAIASDLQSVVQGVLQANQPLGRGQSSTSQQSPFGGGGFRGGGGGPGGFFRAMLASTSNSNAGGTVMADTPSNSLIVTSTETNLDVVAHVIEQLDQPAEYADTTFVYPLKNARADVVANLLNESFGNRTTNGPTGGSLTNTGPSQSTISTTVTASTSLSGSSPGNFGGSNSGNRNNGFGQNGITSSSNSSLSGVTTSLDAEGHVVNVRNLAGEVLLVPNIDTNSIIVVAPPNLQPVVKNVLQSMDVLPAQVMIEAVIMEADLTKQDQFGVEWSESGMKLLGLNNTNTAAGQAFGLSTPGTSSGIGNISTNGTAGAPGATLEKGFTLALTAGKAAAFINAVAQDNKTNVLSTPRILTSNNATAQINISESVPYVSSTTDANNVVTSSFSFLNVGVILTVTPRITDNGYVMMDVSQTANTLLGFVNTAPEVDQRESQATVSIKDGETVVLGGIIQDNYNSTVNKVPLLGDLPLIGNLFKSTNKTKGKTELLVFLTPHVIRTPEDARTVRSMTTVEMDKDMRSQVTNTIRTQPTTPEAPSTDPNAGATATPSIGQPMHVETTVLAPGSTPATLPPTTAGGTITVPAGGGQPVVTPAPAGTPAPPTAPTQGTPANAAVQPKIALPNQPGVSPPAQPTPAPGTVTPGQQ